MKHDKNTGVTTLGPWGKGMNNRASVRSLPDDTVRNVVNADFGANEEIRGRKGFSKVLSCINPRGGYSCPAGCFFVEGFALKQFNVDRTVTTLFSGLTGTEFAYDYMNGVVYFSDGVVTLRVIDGEVFSWGLLPPRAPLLGTTSGVCAAGVYLALCCWVDEDGLESGPSEIASILVGEDTGFVFSNLQMEVADSDAKTSGIQNLRLYLSTADGKELYHVADMQSNTDTYTLTTGSYDTGSVFEGHFTGPPPPGRAICHYKGRVYIADSDGVVWYSDEFNPSLFRRGSSFLLFPQKVDIMLPVKNGIYFAYGNSTDFYEGTPDDGFNITHLFDYGGVYGTGKKISNSENVVWQSQRGAVLGSPTGQAKNVQEENVAVEFAVSGAALLRDEDGIRQFVVSLQQPTTSGLAAKSWITAEKVRRGE